MPVEPIGLVLSVVSLIGLFTTCLELLDAVSSLKYHGAAYQDLVCMFEAEKILLLKWGEAAGLLHNPNSSATQQRYSEHLKDERILLIAAQTLSCLKRKFENANDLIKKYGLRRLPMDDALHTYLDTNTHPSLETVHVRQEQILNRVQSEASLATKARWAIHDRTKFSGLISEITKLNENLRRLVPTDRPAEVEHFVQFEIVNDTAVNKRIILTRIPSHHLVSDATNTQYPDLNGSASEGSIGGIQVRDWLEQINSEYTMDQHSCQEILSVKASTGTNYSADFSSRLEAQSISAKTRIGSSLSRHSLGHNPIEQHIRDRMDKMFFVFFAYMTISFLITIMNVFLLKSAR